MAAPVDSVRLSKRERGDEMQKIEEAVSHVHD
jgi:hypothetical protein